MSSKEREIHSAKLLIPDPKFLLSLNKLK